MDKREMRRRLLVDPLSARHLGDWRLVIGDYIEGIYMSAN
jgi:hypothetical protein